MARSSLVSMMVCFCSIRDSNVVCPCGCMCEQLGERLIRVRVRVGVGLYVV